MKKVIIIEGERPSLMPEGPVLEQDVLGKDVSILNFGIINEKVVNEIANADAIIVRPGTPFGKKYIKQLKKAKIIVSIGVGFDHLDLECAKQNGIIVCNVPNYGTDEVADTAISMIFALHRKLFDFKAFSKKDIKFWDWQILKPIKRFKDCNIGIIGIGRIGTSVARKLQNFGCFISYYDPYVSRGYDKSLGISRIDNLNDLLKSSDIISVHVPLTAETKGMLNADFFKCVKDGAIVVNTARGGLISSLDDLEMALKQRPDLRVATDVLPVEPPVEHTLIRSWVNEEEWLGNRLLINPHSAFYSEESCREIRMFAAQIIRDYWNNKVPYNVVN